ncbi:MAG: hypothetical protein RBQ72_09455 [Desulfobacterium sp.]|nr:hypothetical protein [Desulfobacterium sp.]
MLKNDVYANQPLSLINAGCRKFFFCLGGVGHGGWMLDQGFTVARLTARVRIVHNLFPSTPL